MAEQCRNSEFVAEQCRNLKDDALEPAGNSFGRRCMPLRSTHLRFSSTPHHPALLPPPAVLLGRTISVDAANSGSAAAAKVYKPVEGCWFCLSNPNADVELVASVGERPGVVFVVKRPGVARGVDFRASAPSDGAHSVPCCLPCSASAAFDMCVQVTTFIDRIMLPKRPAEPWRLID